MNLKNYESVEQNRNSKSEIRNQINARTSEAENIRPIRPIGPFNSSDSPSCFWEKLLRLAALGLALLCLAATNVRACCPSFPNNLLDLGDNAVLLAPVAEFERELERMKLAPARFHAKPTKDEQTHRKQSLDAEMADLSAALRRAKSRVANRNASASSTKLSETS